MLRTLRALSVIIAVCWFCAAAASAAERGAAMRFDIPAQSLDGALNAFAEAAGVQLSYPGALSEGLRSPALSGDYTVDQALDQLLEGTGLGYRFVHDRTLTLERHDPLAALVAEAHRPIDYAQVTEPAPDKPQAPAKESEEGPTTLPEITVTASPYDPNDPYNTDYNRPNATTATKTDTPIMETPVSIQVIPQQVLRDQQVVRLGKAVRNVSGVNSRSEQGIDETFAARGFDTRGHYRNGVRVFTDTGIAELSNVERVEVLKGPASVLYGRIEPGGLINIVTKQPTAEPYYGLEQQFGSYDYYRNHIDTGGPLTEGGALGYRFNLSDEDAGSFREFVNTDRLFVAPMLRWNITERTWASLELEYQDETAYLEQGLPFLGSRPAPVPRERNFEEPYDGTDFEHLLVDFNLSHAFNERWTVRHHFTFRRQDLPVTEVPFLLDPDPANCTPENCPIERLIVNSALLIHDYYTSLDLTGKFETWGLGHTLLMGGDYFQNDSDLVAFGTDFLPAIDLFHPVHTGIPPEAREELARNTIIPVSSDTRDWYGLYLQDQIALPFNLHFLGGFRYDHAGGVRTDKPTGVTTEQPTDTAISPRYGLLWRPIPGLSLYGSYVENFGTEQGRPFDNTSLKPETAEQYEVGVKTELFDGRLTGSLALYDLTKQNVVVDDPNPALAALGFRAQIGEVNHRGIELDIAGEVLPGWRLIGAYSYLDSEITKDVGTVRDADGNIVATTAGNTGRRLAGAPRHLGSFWSTFEVQEGLLRGLTLGAGITARDQLEFNSENTQQLPGYLTTNLSAGYSTTIGRSKVSFQVNPDNVADKTIFEGRIPTGRTILGSVRVEF